MRLRRPLAAVLATCAAAAAGCGGDAEAENAYVDDVRDAQQTYVTRFDQVLKRLTATSTLEQDRATLGRFEAETKRFGDDLGKIEVPADVRRQHGALVAVVEDLQTKLGRATADLRSGRVADRARVRTTLSTSVETSQQRLTRAVANINAGLRE